MANEPVKPSAASTETASAGVGTSAAVTSKLMRYAASVVRRYDTNSDGQLDAQEWQAMQGEPAAADTNRDGQLTVQEFARHLAEYGSGRRIRLSANSEAEDALAEVAPGMTDANASSVVNARRETKYTAAPASGTPGWFVERDRDGDGQLSLVEFSPRLRATEVAEFERYDLNGDGMLTPAELAKATSKAATTPATGTAVPTNSAPASGVPTSNP